MIKSDEIRQNLLGCLETALFMRSGPSRFADSRKSMMISFIVPIIVLPLTLITVLTAHPDPSLSTSSMQILVALYALRLFVYLTAFLALVYGMARSMDKMESFYKFATANNWLTLPAAALMAPLIGMFLAGNHDWATIYPLMVFITLYSYAYTAFMATYVLRIPMELACFIAICGMAIHQSSLDLLKWAAVQTLNLIA